MKTSKKSKVTQRQIVDQKLLKWNVVRAEKNPPSGWIKAIRGALGINARQLAERLGLKHSNILGFETREPEGKVTLEMLNKIAHAMNCKLVYAIVPDLPYENLEGMLQVKSLEVAREIVKKVGHSMRLESQGVGPADTEKQVIELAAELKSKMDSRLWEPTEDTKKGSRPK